MNGTTLPPTNNVWHYATTQDAPFQITVRSANGRVATTNEPHAYLDVQDFTLTPWPLGRRKTRPITIRRITTRCTP